MSARVPESCDVPSDMHEGPVRFYRVGWRCTAHEPRPELHPDQRPPGWQRPKLTPAQRDEIRERRAGGESAAELAVEFGVTTETIRNNS